MNQQTRRIFVRSGIIASASVLGGAILSRAVAKEKADEKEEEEVSPAEDLMRDHTEGLIMMAQAVEIAVPA